MNYDFEYALGNKSFCYARNKDVVNRVDSKEVEIWRKSHLDPGYKPDTSNALGFVDIPLGDKAFARLTVGLNLIVGGTASGKTELVKAINRSLLKTDDVLTTHVIYTEPDEHAIVDESALADSIAAAVLSTDPNVILIDSWREYAYSATSGATGRGGLDMALFARLTHLDVVALKTATIMVAVMNPLTSDEEALKAYVSAAEGSVTTVFNLSQPGKFSYSTRLAEAKSDRAHTTATWSLRGYEKLSESKSTPGMFFGSLHDDDNYHRS